MAEGPRVCPSCGRRVPRAVATCRCGAAIPAEAGAEPQAAPDGGRGIDRLHDGGRGRRRRHHRRRRRLLLLAPECPRLDNACGGSGVGTGGGCRCPGDARGLGGAPGVGFDRGEFGSRTAGAVCTSAPSAPSPAATRRPHECARGSRRRRGPRDAGSGAGRSLGRNRQRVLRPPGHVADQRPRRAGGHLRHAAPAGWVERPGACRLAIAGVRHRRAQGRRRPRSARS